MTDWLPCNCCKGPGSPHCCYTEIERLRNTIKNCPPVSESEYVRRLENEIELLRAALKQFVAACDTAPPVSLVQEIGLACEVARRALEPRP